MGIGKIGERLGLYYFAEELQFLYSFKQMFDLKKSIWYTILIESTHDRVVASRAYYNIRGEVRDMSDAELITIYIAILSVLVATSTLTVTFLAYLKPEQKRKKRKKK